MTEKEIANIDYDGYSRKSSESVERQVQSNEDQATVIEGLAKMHKLKLKRIITDSRSAFKSGQREGFNELVKRIESGETQGIICWKLDRLARNPREAGIIMELLQSGKLKRIRTFEKEYKPEDNALLMFVEFGIANQTSRDLGPNVKRGLKSKLAKGWRPGGCPHGYLNTKTKNRGENTIETDPERFDDIKKAWQKLLTGNETPIQILDWLNNERGFRTKKTVKTGGKPLSRSSIYRIFTNVFYAGWFEYGGELYKGEHKKMIELSDFDRAQKILGKRGKPRVQSTEYYYTGAIKCGTCGSGLIGTFHRKLNETTGEMVDYALYFCEACRKKGVRPIRHVNLLKIEEAIERELENLTVPPEFLNWALEIIESQKDEANMDKKHVIESLQKAREACQTRLNKLFDGYTSGDSMNEAEFIQQKNRITNEMGRLDETIAKHKEENPEWLELTRKTFEFATYAHAAFLRGDAKTRRDLLIGLADLNSTIEGKIPSIKPLEWFIPIQEFTFPSSPKNASLEPEPARTLTTKEAFQPLSVSMRGRRDLNPQPPA